MSEQPYRQEVVVKDFDMSFLSMVVFMIKWAFASIPALLILMVIGALLAGVFTAMLGVGSMTGG